MFIDCPRCTSIQIYPNEDETYIQIYPNIVNTKWRGEKWIDMGNPSQSTGDTPLVSDTPVEATTPFFDAEKHIVVSTGFVATPDAKNRWKRWNSSVKPEVDGEESHD